MYLQSNRENCKVLKYKLQQKYSFITEADLCCSNGRKEEMQMKLQEKLSVTREELGEMLKKL